MNVYVPNNLSEDFINMYRKLKIQIKKSIL